MGFLLQYVLGCWLVICAVPARSGNEESFFPFSRMKRSIAAYTRVKANIFPVRKEVKNCCFKSVKCSKSCKTSHQFHTFFFIIVFENILTYITI